MPTHLYIVYNLFLAAKAALSSFDGVKPHNLKYFLSALYIKSLRTPDLYSALAFVKGFHENYLLYPLPSCESKQCYESSPLRGVQAGLSKVRFSLYEEALQLEFRCLNLKSGGL